MRKIAAAVLCVGGVAIILYSYTIPFSPGGFLVNIVGGALAGLGLADYLIHDL